MLCVAEVGVCAGGADSGVGGCYSVGPDISDVEDEGVYTTGDSSLLRRPPMAESLLACLSGCGGGRAEVRAVLGGLGAGREGIMSMTLVCRALTRLRLVDSGPVGRGTEGAGRGFSKLDSCLPGKRGLCGGLIMGDMVL